MKKVISIGEALIDFIPQQKGVALKDVEGFLRVPGGAPLNVAAAVAKLGGKSQILTKLGVDGFGDAILEEVMPLGVDVTRIKRTKEANTALAFVSLKEDGERDFSFYRNPGADMMLTADEVQADQVAGSGGAEFANIFVSHISLRIFVCSILSQAPKKSNAKNEKSQLFYIDI